MHVLELSYPGIRIADPDEQRAQNTLTLFYLAERELTQATMALNMFEQELIRVRKMMMEDRPSNPAFRKKRDAEAQRRQEIESHIRSQEGFGAFDYTGFLELRKRVETAFRHEQWSNGVLPGEYQTILPFMYARLFLLSVESIWKLISALEHQSEIVAEGHSLGNVVAIRHAKASFHKAFPDLKGVRDTTAHLEDRGRGLDRNRKSLDLKPVSNRLFNAPAGVLAIESLNGNRIGSTMSDGNYGEVEVSIETLRVVQESLQAIIDAFNWEGPSRHSPL
jgi:hypothetical protein